MNFKTVSLLLIICLSFTIANAQQNTITASVDTIQYFKGSNRFRLNNRKLNYTEMKAMLNTFNSSALELRLHKKRATPATLVLLTGLTAGVLAMTKLGKSTHFFSPYSVTLYAGNLIGIPLMISANKHLKKSIKLYNQEIRR